MEKASEGRIVRRKAGEIPATSPEELARMRAIPDEAIDFSDIPKQIGNNRLIRDDDGRLPGRRSLIRQAVVDDENRRQRATFLLRPVQEEMHEGNGIAAARDG